MKIIMLAASVALLALSGVAGANEYCGSLENHYGPFDYRTEKGKLPIVDHAHFTEDVEAGIKGSTDALGGDLDYTLRAFPNHHRALATLARVALRDKTLMIYKTKWPVECYFLRAERFAPDDAVVHATYGSYLYGAGKFDKALAEYKQAIDLDPDNSKINYDIGLAYMKNNDIPHALEHARKAYDKGYPLPGLKTQLIKAGAWTEHSPN
jgi:tetratricopeptide (TPR) repeat protein